MLINQLLMKYMLSFSNYAEEFLSGLNPVSKLEWACFEAVFSTVVLEYLIAKVGWKIFCLNYLNKLRLESVFARRCRFFAGLSL